jgi:ZIP family zinc transporter
MIPATPTPPQEYLAIAFGLTFFAGLATAIGSAVALYAKRTNYAFLAGGLSFSAGVMLYVSFAEILPKATDALVEAQGERRGAWAATLAFFAGLGLIALIDRITPKAENPHEVHAKDLVEEVRTHEKGKALHAAKLLRMGKLAALAIAIHNFPEGMATFFSALYEPAVGAVLALAIALHNIPEGVSVSVPIYFATGDRKKAFWLSALSGMAEPLGAILGYVLLKPFFSPMLFGVLFGVVAGIMVFVSLDELLPTAREYGEDHQVVYGTAGGMAVMALSLLLLK